MGFFSALFDVFISVADMKAKKIDKMSDEELENSFQNSGKSASAVREMAANAHMLKKQRENNNSEDQ